MKKYNKNIEKEGFIVIMYNWRFFTPPLDSAWTSLREAPSYFGKLYSREMLKPDILPKILKLGQVLVARWFHTWSFCATWHKYSEMAYRSGIPSVPFFLTGRLYSTHSPHPIFWDGKQPSQGNKIHIFPIIRERLSLKACPIHMGCEHTAKCWNHSGTL